MANRDRSDKGISSVISTIIITAALLVVLIIASFVATNILGAQMADSEFQQAQSNMLLLDSVIQDVSLRQGAGSYVQFNQITGGIGVATDPLNNLVITAGGQTQTNASTLTLLPDADGTYSDWSVYPSGNKWAATSDNNDATGIQITGLPNAIQTENIQDPTPNGTITSLTTHVRGKAIRATTRSTYPSNMNFTGNANGWSTITLKNGQGGAAAFGYDNANGNTLGSGIGSYRNNVTNTGNGASDVADYNFTNEASFSYASSGNLASVFLSYAFCVTGNVATSGNSLTIYLVIPDGTAVLLKSVSFSAATPWSYSRNESVPTTSFDQGNGTYKLRVVSRLIAVKGSNNNVRLYFDDIGLEVQSYSGSSDSLYILWRSSNLDYQSSAKTISQAFADYSDYQNTNPISGQLWSWAELNSLEVGVQSATIGASDTIQISKIWVEVNYTVVQFTPGNEVFRSQPLTKLVYRAGTSTSGAAQALEGSSTASVSVDQPLAYLRIETGSGLKINLDYNRVRVVSMGQQDVGGVPYNFTGITFVQLTAGSMGGSGTVNVKAQNAAITTTYLKYANSPKTNLIQTYLTSNNQPTTLLTITPGSNAIIILTVVQVNISIG